LSNKVFAHFFQCALLLFCNRPCVSVPFLSLVRTTCVIIISIVIYTRIIIQDKQAAKKRVLQTKGTHPRPHCTDHSGRGKHRTNESGWGDDGDVQRGGDVVLLVCSVVCCHYYWVCMWELMRATKGPQHLQCDTRLSQDKFAPKASSALTTTNQNTANRLRWLSSYHGRLLYPRGCLVCCCQQVYSLAAACTGKDVQNVQQVPETTLRPRLNEKYHFPIRVC
jgi:hypothetical protein